jgi:hypothetical protein
MVNKKFQGAVNFFFTMRQIPENPRTMAHEEALRAVPSGKPPAAFGQVEGTQLPLVGSDLQREFHYVGLAFWLRRLALERQQPYEKAPLRRGLFFARRFHRVP